MAKTGRKVRGSLYKKNGKWYVAWMAFGVRNRRCTGIAVGRGLEAKENRKKAEALRDEWVGAYKAGDEADVRAALVERQRSAEAVAEERMAAVMAEANRIPLAEAWSRFPYNTSQLTRGRTAVHPLSPRNVRENEVAWEKFVTWVKDTHGPGKAMQDVTPEWAEEYSKHLQALGLTPSRHNLLILVAGVMYRLAKLPNPFEAVPKLQKQAAQHREPFTKEQVARMLSAATGEWKGFLAVLYYTGLRAGDAVLLAHSNRVNGQVRVTTAKTDAQVVMLEHPQLTAILDEVIDRHPSGRSAPLFPKLAALYREKGPAALSRKFESFIRRTLGTYEVAEDGTESFIPFEAQEDRKRGVRKISRYGLHSFRHTLATEAARAGIPIASVQRWLGHTSSEITRIYADHSNADERQKLVAAAALTDAPTPSGALPPASPLRDALGDIVEAVGGMNAENWQEVRARVLELAAKAERGEE